jgi:hypothetical protein
MPVRWGDIPADALAVLRRGAVIPAHPLALTEARELDRRRQRALSRYYIDAGAGGLAVGVHTTQFAIRERGLYEPVLRTAAEATAEAAQKPMILIAGLCGKTEQARREAAIARDLGFHAGLLSLAAMANANEDELIAHCQTLAEEIPLVGFYLQRAVGGCDLPASFWRRFAAIENVIAIKMAPFNRYRTIDVVRGVAEAGAEDRVTLYTGNDDHILLDLLTRYRMNRNGDEVFLRIVGGLLGQWSVWTKAAVDILEQAHKAAREPVIPAELLTLDAQLTDANGALFDVRNDFAGCIAGCHEILRRQGLLENLVLIDPAEGLGPGQNAEIDRVVSAYPHLTDDAFVAKNLEKWLS